MKKNTILSGLSVLAVAFTVIGCGAMSASAQFWNGNVNNDWHNAANWDGGAVPAFGNNATIASDVNTSTVADITSANVEADGIFVGLEVNGSVVDGTVNHSGFTGTYTNGMIIGRGGATGTYNQTLTSVVNTAFIAVGTEDGAAINPPGTGFYNLSGDSELNASSFVIMGELFGSAGTMTLNDNAVLNANFDNGGVGDVSLIVGREGSTGTLNIHDDAIVNAADRIQVGDFFGAKGTINQDGNSVVNSKTVWLGVFDDASAFGTEGTYNISGTATLNTDNIIVGRDGGKGTLDVSGSADVNVNGAFVVGDFNGTAGAVANGVVNQDGGDVSSTAWIGIGNAAGTIGEYNLTSGSLHTDADFKVGDNGTGTVNQDGGSATAGTWMAIGSAPGSVGTYNLNGGTVATGTGGVADDLNVGDGGTGTVNQTGGSLLASRDLNVGKQNGSVGTYNQDGGDATANSWVIIANDAGSNGTYNLRGGSLHSDGVLSVGDDGTGVLTQDTTSAASAVTTIGDLYVGRTSTSNGTYNQNGGTVTIGVANDGTGSWLRIGDEAGAQGTYNMTAGTLTVNGRLELGVEGGNGDFNLSGGNVIVQDGGPDGGGNAQPGSLVVGRRGDGDFTQTAGSITAEYVDIGGDPGFTPGVDFTNGGSYSLGGGSLTTTSNVGIRIGISEEMPVGSGSSFDVENATITSGGNLEVGRNSNGTFRTFGSNVTATFAGNLDTSTGSATGVLGWGSDAAGVSALEFSGDVDITDGVLQAVFVPFVGLPTADIAAPHDLLLIDNQGHTWVDGLFSFDQDLDGVGDQLLAQGDLLIDPNGLLGGVDYYVSYYGLTGSDNDIFLTLAPVLAVANADFDADGDVDGFDFLTWQQGFGGIGLSRPDGDADADPFGSVDGADFGIWSSQYGSTQPIPLVSGAIAVPEPTSLALLIGPMALMLLRRRQA